MFPSLFDFVAAHSQQTADFIKGDYDGGSAELFISARLLLWRQALLSTRCPHFTKFACHETPSGAGLTKARSDSASISFPLSLYSADGEEIFCLLTSMCQKKLGLLFFLAFESEYTC